MTNDTRLDGVRVPSATVAHLDQLAVISGETRAEVASRLLVTAVENLGRSEQGQQQAYSLLDIDEELVGP